MAFKLAEAYTQLTARTAEHDRAVERSINKVKEFGKETLELTALNTKLFLTVTLGAASLTAALVKAAGAVHGLIGKLYDAAKAGKGFGDEIARWTKETFGFDNAVTRLDAKLKALGQNPSAGAILDALAGRGGPRSVEGSQLAGGVLSPAIDANRASQFAEQRAALESRLLEAFERAGPDAAKHNEFIKEMSEVSGNSRAVTAENFSDILPPGIIEAQQDIEQLELALKQLDEQIKIEAKFRAADLEAKQNEKRAIDLAVQAVLNFGHAVGGAENALLRAVEGAVGLGQPAPGEVNGGAIGMMGRGARQRADEVARMFAEAERALNNADPVALGRMPALPGVTDKRRGALMGAEEASRSILEATAGKSPELEELKRQTEISKKIEENQRMELELRRKGPAHAVWAEGVIA